MGRKAARFDAKAFLTRVDAGRSASGYHKRQAIFAQGDPADAVFYLEKGQVKLTDSNGASRVFRKGDAFVVEPGFDGVWESLSRVRKHYVLCEV